MKKISFILYFIFSVNILGLFANTANNPEYLSSTPNDSVGVAFSDTTIQLPKHQKLKAALLALTLGHFGAHRIYLNTNPRIPAAYTFTLGGLGILPLIDIVNIIFTKDISRFQNSSKFFMWQDEPIKSVIQP
jgi:TM2 domain-containing membrane protein YozV